MDSVNYPRSLVAACSILSVRPRLPGIPAAVSSLDFPKIPRLGSRDWSNWSSIKTDVVVLGTHDQGLIITTSDFSAGARIEAERPNAVPVALMNGEQLVRLLVEHDIGMRRTAHELIELADESED